MTHEVIQSKSLWSTKAGADKLYNLFLRPKGEGWVVDYTNGKRGGTLRSGTKTEHPAAYQVALKVFESTLRAKIKEGYGEVGDGQAYTSSEFAGRATGLDVQLLTAIDETRCKELLADDGWIAQIKENGERRPLFVKDGNLTGANRSGLLVDIPEAWLSQFGQFGNAVFDGEHVGENYFVFDLLEFDGEDLRPLPFAARYLRLTQFLESRSGGRPNIRLVEAHSTQSTKERLLGYVRRHNLEGLVFKRVLAPYGAGRSDDALKFKLTDSATCIVVRRNSQRSVVVGMLNAQGALTEYGNVTIPGNYVVPNPDDLIEVQFLYFTGQAFEQPVYQGKRTDLPRADARLEQIKRVKPPLVQEAALA